MQPDFQKAREDLYESKKKSAEDALETARTDHKTAYESGDSEKLLEVSEKIADLKYDLKNLESSPKPIEQSLRDQTSDTVSSTPKPQVDPKALMLSRSRAQAALRTGVYSRSKKWLTLQYAFEWARPMKP